MTIGQKLRSLREKAGYSQQYVADILQVERTTYVKWENGSSKPNKKIAELAKLFNVTTDYLLGYDKETESIYDKDKSGLADEAYQLLIKMPPEMQKTAITQLKALADMGKEGK